jgi:hypothetical protein
MYIAVAIWSSCDKHTISSTIIYSILCHLMLFVDRRVVSTQMTHAKYQVAPFHVLIHGWHNQVA